MMDKDSGQPRFRTDSSSPTDVSFSNEISTSTLVKLLVSKGILTTSEIFEEERQTRLKQLVIDDKIHHHLAQKKRKQSRLKRWASKHRWSRRLTTKLFGWEWKKSQHTHPSELEEHS